ncbi:MAG TPA: RNA polymerase sigma factor RpoD/SigA [Candidatus Aminicenantes bacterium]|jgi:RNA polymerase primary sigma factor|nr:RNA polymerase sigma factor RpoD/SigA [Candidatus Aminicenantes bacterium]
MTSYKDYTESRNLRRYLEQIGRFPRLTEEQERELAERIHAGDAKALERMIEGNLRFVVSYVKKYKGMGLDMLDLINEGNLGLIEAAKRFDPGRNVKFISYAVWWIRQAVIHSLTASARITHVPQKISDQMLLMKRKVAQLSAGLGREPNREEIAAAMKMTVSEIEDLALLENKEISLNDRFDEDGQGLEEKIGDPISPSVEYQIIKASILNQVREILSELDEKEATVLKLRFGLDDDRPLTLQEIGDRLHLTRERIRQIEQTAMTKLSRSHKLQELRGYLN